MKRTLVRLSFSFLVVLLLLMLLPVMAAAGTPPTGIQGTVTDMSGLRLRGVTVDVYRSTHVDGDPWTLVASAKTDAGGTYRVTGLSADQYRVTFAVGSTVFVEQEQYVTIPGGSMATVNAALQRRATISGVVTGVGDAPLADATVTLWSASADWWWYSYPIASTTTDAAGRYSFTGLVPTEGSSRYSVSFEKADYSSEWYDDVEWWSGYYYAQRLQVGSGQTLTGIDARLAAVSHISGRVTNASGDAIPGIYVYAFRLDAAGGWGYQSSVPTDESGDYDLILPAGTYRVRFHDYSSTYNGEWFDDAPDLETASDVVVSEGATVPGVGAELSRIPYASVEGTVTGSGGQPLEGASVYVWRWDGAWFSVYDSTVTDADGGYRFGRLGATGEGQFYVVGFSHPDYFSQWFDGVVDLESASHITLSEAEERTGVDARMQARGRISGTVTDGTTGLPSVEVQFYRANESGGWDMVDYAGTDASGNYTKTLDPGTYRVGFHDYWWPQRVVNEFYDDAATVDEAADVEVVAGATTTGVDAAMQSLPTSSISGTVTDMAGTPVAGATVSLMYRYSSWYYWYEGWLQDTTTDATGRYEFTGLPVGQCYWGDAYAVRFSHPDFQTEYFDDAASVWTATGWGSLDEAGLSGIDAQLERAGGLSHITGRVTDPGGAAVAGMSVFAVRKIGPGPWDWNWVQWAQTDGDGVYDLAELEPGRYTVYFEGLSPDLAPEYYDDAVREDQATSFRVEYDSTVSGIDAELSPYGSLTGHVSDAAGAPLAGVGVEVWQADNDSCSMTRATTDENGDYDVGGLDTRDYKVQFIAPDDRPELLDEWFDDGASWYRATVVPVVRGQTTGSIDAVLSDGAEIAGTVTDPDGTALEGVEVRAYARRTPYVDTSVAYVVAMAVTDSSGGYQLGTLSGGDYEVGYFDPQGRYGGEYFDDAAVIGDATPVAVPPDGHVTGIDAALSAGGGITGTVTGPDGVGIGGVTVKARFRGPGRTAWWYQAQQFNDDYVKTTVTAADGTYAFANLSAGNHRISCEADDYHTRWYVDSPDRGGSTPVTVPRGETIGGIDVQLIPAGSIRGTVTASAGTHAFSGGTVRATRVDEWGNEYERSTASIAEDGTYTLRRLVGGTYWVQFSVDGYLTEWWDDCPDGLPYWEFRQQVDLVTVADGEPTSGIDATLMKESTISGTVTTPDGAPIEGVWVQAQRWTEWGTESHDAWTDAAGAYTVTDLRAGEWSIGIHPPSPYVGEHVQTVTVGVEEDVTGIDAVFDTTSMEARLGQKIFDDTDLSTPTGQSCSTCHAAEVGWTGPDSAVNAVGAVYQGACDDRFGNRKPPSIAYAGFSPVLYRNYEGDWVGGMFWDGRASGWILGDPLVEQAQGPFLNPLEQNMAGPRQVVDAVAKSDYADLFRQVWGPTSLTVRKKGSADAAYEMVARSVAHYEKSSLVGTRDSKYDAWLEWQVELSDQEMQGLELFNGKANCSACHPADGDIEYHPPLTDFTYDNLGVPRNGANPFYSMPVGFNPAGDFWIDEGLGGFLRSAGWPDGVWAPEVGKFKVPTLRNVDKRPSDGFVKAYGHNGYFKSLEEIVHFYNTRDVPGEGWNGRPWPEPEVSANLNTTELGDLGLTAEEEAAIVAFLKTLTDGWVPPVE